MKNSRAKLVFSCLLNCGKENIIYSFSRFTSFVIEFFRNRKKLSTKETQPILKRSLLPRLKGKAFLYFIYEHVMKVAP